MPLDALCQKSLRAKQRLTDADCLLDKKIGLRYTKDGRILII
jgi:hypothetical protein